MSQRRPSSRGRLPRIPVFQYEDMRNNDAFPNYASLPQNNQDRRYYDQTQKEGPKPKKHWCLLVEISSVVFNDRLIIECSDITGYKIGVAFHNSDGGRTFHVKQELNVGNTLAIMYPHRGADRPNGIRIEDASRVKVFPTTLENLLILNDEIQYWPVDFARHERCHACGKGDWWRGFLCLHCGIVANVDKRIGKIEDISTTAQSSETAIFGN
ncbi:hypothetical protein FE257_001747 [Aspergillus nanangensis]|uniref:Uncharacterized protein n=1 Tax=Aspergillus nanangensis TaxID=2582783 RepID=A0AAD4GPI8_ASPNN|nr:hypothetical protein FE257_001747 [Aspergillus nanangensis]